MDDKTIIMIVVMKKIVLNKWYDVFNITAIAKRLLEIIKNTYCFAFRVMFNVAMPMWLTMEIMFSSFAFLF